MQFRPNRLAGRYLGFLAIFLFGPALAGCSLQTRQQALDFFFTGVPPLEELHKSPITVTSRPKEQPADPAGLAAVKDRKTAPGETEAAAQAPVLFSHPVWTEGDCSACHAGTGSFGFQSGGAEPKGAAAKLFNSGGGIPGKLRHPKEKVCLTCHKEKTGLRAIKDNLWLHNTTAKGECLACHDPHQSRLRGMLRVPAEELCRSCHQAEELADLPVHSAGPEPCLSCHDPHMGRDRRLLRQDYPEKEQAARLDRNLLSQRTADRYGRDAWNGL